MKECGFPSGSRPTRVLVIDDDPSIQQMLADYLAQHNVRVAAALRQQEVARQFATTEPDVVILDLRLGTDDGLDVLRQIRSRSDVPVIITTGHRREEVDRVVGLELGADAYITKPFGLRELLARIRAVLQQAGRKTEPTAGVIDSQSAKSAEKGGPASIPSAMMRARRSRARSGTSW